MVPDAFALPGLFGLLAAAATIVALNHQSWKRASPGLHTCRRVRRWTM